MSTRVSTSLGVSISIQSIRVSISTHMHRVRAWGHGGSQSVRVSDSADESGISGSRRTSMYKWK